MQSFKWVDATSVEHAVTLLSQSGDETIAKAGGVDILDLMKEGIVAPTRVVNLKLIDELRGLRFDSQGLRLGALTTLAEIATHPQLVKEFRALSDAASHAATPQIRNVATIGGNLLQRPRCWYFRNAQLHKVANEAERIREGEHQYHGIFNNAITPLVNASTLATALIAYGASVHLRGLGGRERNILLQDFLLPPDAMRDRDADIARDEVLTHITVPATAKGTRVAYHKQTERDSYDWPILDVAVVLQLQDEVVTDAKIVVGSVAPTPMRAYACERVIKSSRLTEAVALQAAQAIIKEATPFARNAYKVPILEAVLTRTVLVAANNR